MRALALAGLLTVLASTAASAGTVTVPGNFATIQAAIDGAPDGSTIQIAPGHYNEHLHFDYVTRPLNLVGDPTAPGNVVVDGGGQAGSVIRMQFSSNLTFDGLTITGGTGGAGLGGGLYMANADAVFRNCVFTGNSSNPDGGGAFILTAGGRFEDCVFTGNSAARFGGGVLMNVGATTTFERCQFTNNIAGTSDDVNGWGGGLHVNDSSPVIINSVISGNQSKFAAGGISVTGHFTVAESVATLTGVEIANNTVTRGNATLPAAEAGGMHIEDNVHAVLTRCHVHDNNSNTGGGLNSYRGHYEIVDSVIENNHAVAITPDAVGGFGGGIFAASVTVANPVRPATVIELRGTVVRGNTAHVGAGMFVQGDFSSYSTNEATLDVSGSLIAGNVATGRGGGIFVDRTQATITSTQLLLNQVTAATGSWGGGVASVGSSTTAITNSTIAGNSVGELGGGIYADQGGSLTVTGSHLTGNTAASSGGLGGGAIGIAQAVGPKPGPVSGTVSNSDLGDNGTHYEIWESNCDLSHWSTVVYQNNNIHNSGAVYYRNCTGATASVASFNGIAGKASGNVDAVPSFVAFSATPAAIRTGATAVLAWAAPGKSSLSIDNGVGSVGSAIGTADVTPAMSTTYTFKTGASSIGTADVTVTCDGPGAPVLQAPANGNQTQRPSAVTLTWLAGSGAVSYDVYLDTSADPTTAVASGLTSTSFDLPPLTPSTTYHWKVVAVGAGCPTTTATAVSTFTTCATDNCAFDTSFDSPDLSTWTIEGKGTAAVVNGHLRISAPGRKKIRLTPPAADVGDGTISMTVGFEGGKKELRILFARQNDGEYRALYVRGKNGQVKLLQRDTKKLRTVKTARSAFPRGADVGVRIDLTGPTVDVTMDGAAALSQTFSSGQIGTVAFEVFGGTVTVDDLHIAPAQ